MPKSIDCVLFDLDGTLADTAPDLAAALNSTLQHFGQPTLPFKKIRPHVSHGGIALIKAGFRIEPDHPEFETYRLHLLDFYLKNICQHTRLFDGMAEVLAYLEKHQIHWGVVTNKPAWLTDPLMEQMQLNTRAVSIVSGDTCAEKKPHPMPILFACEQAGVDPQNCLYVGDAQRDIESGKAAGCTTVTALFGYMDEGDDPHSWNGDLTISHPTELITYLQTNVHV